MQRRRQTQQRFDKNTSEKLGNDARKFVRDLMLERRTPWQSLPLIPANFLDFFPPHAITKTNKYIQLMAITVQRDDNNTKRDPSVKSRIFSHFS